MKSTSKPHKKMSDLTYNSPTSADLNSRDNHLCPSTAWCSPNVSPPRFKASHLSDTP